YGHEAHLLIKGQCRGVVQRAGFDRDDPRGSFPSRPNRAPEKPARQPLAEGMRHQAKEKQTAFTAAQAMQLKEAGWRSIHVEHMEFAVRCLEALLKLLIIQEKRSGPMPVTTDTVVDIAVEMERHIPAAQ